MKNSRVALLLAAAALAQGQDRAAIERWVAGHQRQVMTEFTELLSIPDVGTDRPNIRRNAEFLRAMLERHGLKAELLETTGNPLVYAERNVPGATRTTLFYIHYDGQPIDAAKWKQDSPFHPLMREGRMEDGAKTIANFAALDKLPDDWRIYARSASDDKAPIVALCAALDALQGKTRSNIHVVLDGEEEMNSPSLTAAIARYREKLRANLLLILDGPVHAGGRPTLAFGARGIVTVELTVFGPKMALHSGHYGNWIPNPGMRLAQLLATMKDDQGRTTIAGFYDSVPPLTAQQRQVLKSVPDDEPALLKLFGVAHPDAVGESLQEAIQFPSLNVRGMRSGYVDEPRTIIPPDATAAIDIRLVKETPSARMLQLLRAHLEKQGYHVIAGEPDDATRMKYAKLVRLKAGEGTEAYRTEPESADAAAVTQALTRMWGAEPVRIRTMGGTVPIAPFIRELGLPAVGVPIVNFDNNQHGDNENLRLGNLWSGIVTLAATLEM
ncbi:MAG TPA: M20/M25/M40 family metallo-hydrolase [Candidatus Sulfopaludibacter sp.]|jgi:acetylornithine deacetylase/succinyl-diaminopimelate desuccinylase-like protein|nr:M20/M25/M40 family metallo-hydrolase [Candidatus Sulfopaludibacter sp.]